MMFRGDLYLPPTETLTSGVPITPQQSIRWLSCRNMFNDWIPPFACMMLDGFGRGAIGSLDNQGDDYWPVTRCDDIGERYQNPAAFFFNSELPILPYPHGWGQCTRDYPARVLHDGRVDGLGPSMPCGPVKDKWYVASTGSAWTCMGHRVADPNVPGYGNVHTVWITGERTLKIGEYASDNLDSLIVSAGSAFGIDLTIRASDAIVYDGAAAQYKVKKGLRNAPFLASFGATVYSPSAPRGAQLIVSMTHRRKSGATRKVYKGMREQDIEVDGYGTQILLTTKENVAITAILDLEAEDTIQFKNESGYSISLLHINICFGQFGSQGFLIDTPGG